MPLSTLLNGSSVDPEQATMLAAYENCVAVVRTC